MTARILIVDGVATNRIVLKVKMRAAQYMVTACASRAEAEQAITCETPDLVILNPWSDGQSLFQLCRNLRGAPATRNIGIIATGADHTAKGRFAALDAGADDVLSHPLNDTLLMARVRSLLRLKTTGQELALRDSTSRALGFDEARTGFATAAQAVLVGAPDTLDHAAFADMAIEHGARLQTCSARAILKLDAAAKRPDLIIIDARSDVVERNCSLRLISELRARMVTRQAAIMVVAHDPGDAALYLDLGAEDVLHADVAAAELALRARRLITRKQQQDGLRASVRSGLQAAITDPLTGLYNRRYVTPHLSKMAQEAQGMGRNFAVMMLDIDHFKSINDRFGHSAGDAVLIAVAARLRDNLRAIDLIGRIGGEEFIVAMPRTTARQARLAAERLRRVIGHRPFTVSGTANPIKVSISVGVAISGGTALPVRPVTELCDFADRALYRAKAAGRNQVAMARSAA